MTFKRRTGRTLLLVRALLYIALAVALLLTIRRLAFVLAPVGTGLFLAYLLDPLVTRLERRGIPRGAAVTLLVLGCGVVGALVLLVVPPLLSGELEAFSERWQQYESRLQQIVVPWLRKALHLPARTSTSDILLNAVTQAGTILRGATGDLGDAAASAMATARGLLRVLLGVLLTPVFAIYFLMDFRAIARTVRELVPPRHQDTVLGIFGEVNRALASWMRGQLTAMVILAVAYASGLALAGIPLGIGIGIVTGLLAFVPYVGVAVGFVLAVAAALLDWHGTAAPLVGVVITFAAVQTTDSFVITPRVVGGRVGLSPVAVIFALLAGGELLGYPGLLLAVPAAAVFKVLIGHARRAYTASAFYAGAETNSDIATTATTPTVEKKVPRVIEGGRS